MEMKPITTPQSVNAQNVGARLIRMGIVLRSVATTAQMMIGALSVDTLRVPDIARRNKMTCRHHTPVIGGLPASRMQQLRYIADNYDTKYTTGISVAELRVFMSLLEGIETMNSVKLCDAMTEAKELLGETK